jgi:hypothetical protein
VGRLTSTSEVGNSSIGDVCGSFILSIKVLVKIGGDISLPPGDYTIAIPVFGCGGLTAICLNIFCILS